MLILRKNEKLFAVLKWGVIALLSWTVGKQFLQKVYLIDAFLDRSATSLGGTINLVIAYIVLVMAFFSPFVLLRLKPVSLIAVTIALFPFFVRSSSVFGIYGYTSWHGGTVLICGITLFAPVLFCYLLLWYPVEGRDRGWWLPSSKAFWGLAVSGVMMQFLFFPVISAIRIAYLLIGFQLLWYLIIVAYVNSIEDSYKIMWGIVIGLTIGWFLSSFTGGQGILLDPIAFYQSKGRLESMLFGSINEYPGVLVSIICLLPILFYRSRRLGKIIILVLGAIFLRDLLLSVTRGAYIASLASILGYIFVLRPSKKAVISLIGLLLIVFLVFWDQIVFFLLVRADIDLSGRLFRWKTTLEDLATVPNFLTGIGMATSGNFSYSVHYPHQGFLFVWVNSGLVGLVGFSLWIGCAIKEGVKKAMRSYNFEHRLVLMGLVLSVSSMVIFFMLTAGRYTSGELQEMYAIFTTEVALLVALGQKKTVKW
jgi:hypothetical protein